MKKIFYNKIILLSTAVVFVLLNTLSFLAPSYAASVPTILSYQGRLSNSSGDLLGSSGTTYYFKFSIWDNATVGSGNRVWPTSAPTLTSATVRQGVFTVNIGDTSAGYPDALDYNFSQNTNVYLQVEVSSDGSTFQTLSPRQRISSTSFSQVAGAVSGTNSSFFGTTSSFGSSVVSILASSTSAIPLSIRAATGQTASLLQIQDSLGGNLFFVNASGAVFASSTLSVDGAVVFGSTLSAGTTTVNNLIVSNTSTSTFAGGLSTFALNITGTASSTFANGIQLTGGCFRGSDGACITGGGGGAVSSVSNSDSTLTISPTTGGVVASLNLTNPNTWTGKQTFNQASSTLFSVASNLYVGSTATTTIVGDLATSTLSGGLTLSSGNVNLPSSGVYLINNQAALLANALGASILASSLTSVGALDSGSITSNFGSINTGADNITTTGLGSFGNLALTGSSTLQNFTAVNATTTSATSTSFQASTLGVGSSYFTSLLGSGLQNSSGVLTLNTAGDWTGTFDTREGSYYLDANNLTNFGTPFYSFFSATNTTALAEGTNLYWTNTRFDNRLSASSSIAGITTLANLSLPFSQTTGTVGPTRGGTGITSAPSYGELLLGNASSGYTLTGTSSLGLPLSSDLLNYLSLSSWFGTTTDVLDEGTNNLYFTNTRADNRAIAVLSATTSVASIVTLGNLTSVGALSSGSIVSGFGSINTGANSITTTGLGSFGNLALTGSSTLQNFTAVNATTTSATSTSFQASTLGVGSSYFTSLLGSGLQNSSGVLTLNTAGDWTGTFDTREGSYYLDANNLTNFGTPFYSFFSATNTTALAEGTNLYWTNTRFDNRLSASSSIAGITTLANLTTTGALNAGSITSGFGSIDVGADNITTTGQGNFGTLNATGLAMLSGQASTTRLSVFDQIYIGSTATSTLQGNTTGTSTLQGFLNVLGTNSTSTFSGGLSANVLNIGSASATSTFSTGGLTVGGSQFVVQQNSGFVGIGTTTPYVKLGVAGNGVFDGNVLSSYFTATSTTATSTFAGGLTLETSGLVYDWQTNRVGIGTASPATSLHVDGDITLGSTSNVITQIHNATADGSDNGYIAIGGGGTSNNSTRGAYLDLIGNEFSGLGLYGTAILSAGQATGGVGGNIFLSTDSGSGSTVRLTVANAGNIGIGTTTPAWNFQIAGTRPSLAISDTSAGTNQKHWLFSSMGGNLYVGTSTDDYATSTPPALTILSNGSFGIGTTTPWAKLSVNNYSSGLSTTPLFTVASSTGTGATSTAFIVNSVGSVGIGTNSPIASLQIGSLSSADINNVVAKSIIFGSNVQSQTSETVLRLGRDISGFQYFAGTVDFNIDAFKAGGAGDTYNPATRLTIALKSSRDNNLGANVNVMSLLNTGNVGIGTTTPAWNFQIAGTRPSLAISDTSAGTNQKHWLFSSMGGNLYVGTSTDDYATSTPPALTILSNGSFGIGTSTPISRLSVAGGGASFENAVLASSIATNLTPQVGHQGYVNLSGGLGTGGVDSLTPALRLTSSGNLVNIGSIQAGELNITYGGTFMPKVDYTTILGPHSVAVGDVNNDGRADLIVGSYFTVIDSAISVFINNGAGTFASQVNYGIGSASGSFSVATADLNGDGKLDLASANRTANTASVLINKGNGTFASAVTYTAGTSPYSITIADVNGDGKPDLAVANFGSNTVSVFINNGNGTFATKVDYTTGASPYSVAIADMNGDGKADMAVANAGATTVSLFINNGNGTFATKQDYTAGTNPYSVTMADLNGDSKVDLVAANYNSNTVSVFINNGASPFSSQVTYGTGTGPQSVTVADVNGDGKPDLAVANATAGTVSVLTNKGDGTFNTKVDYATNTDPESVVAGDLNGDGKPDLAVANYGSITGSTMSVFLNTSSASATSSLFASGINGRVGIGTTTPAWNFQIAGTRPSLAISDTSAGTNQKHWLISSMGGNLFFGTSTDAYATSTPAALTILNNGSLGVGTTTPYVKLGVAGNGVFDGNVLSSYFTATSTTATSTFAGGLQGLALNITSTTATSTFANGIVINNGGGLRFAGLDCSGSSGLLQTDSLGNVTCGVDDGGAGAGVSTIKENNVSIVTSANAVDFNGNDFIINDETGGEAGIAIDYSNSGITRKAQNETISGDWTFSNVSTTSFSGGIDATYLNLTGSTASSTFAGGLIINSGGLRLATLDCSGIGKLLQTDSSGNLVCGDDDTSAGAGVSTIQEGDATIEGTATTIDFLGADFTVTSSPSGEANVVIDYTNSGIARKAENETVSGLWAFSNVGTTTFTGGLATSRLNVTSGTSTFANGIQLTGGCIQFNGSCIATDGVNSVTPASYIASTTWTKSNYPGIKYAYVIVTGGGGSGGGATASDTASESGGGGGGAGGTTIETFLASELGATESVSVGLGGPVGATVGSNGNVGNPSYFGTLLGAYAGNAGEGASTATFLIGNGGTGGAASSTGDITLSGGGGGAGSADADHTFGGVGGASYWGGGGRGGIVNGGGVMAGQAASSLGSGGGGGAAVDASGGTTGGLGGTGTVVVFAYTSTGGDLAEWYETKGNVEPGDVVSVGTDSIEYESFALGLQKSSVLEKATAGSSVVGVVSNMPYQVMGGDVLGASKEAKPIALVGRVPVKVTEENGKIKKGDHLALSSIAGVAMRSTKAGVTIGKALEDSNCEAGKECKVLVLVNTSYSTGQLIKVSMAEDGIDMDTIPGDLDFGRIVLAQMIRNKQSITASSTVSEILTDRLAAGLEVITPRLVADKVVTNTIEPVSDSLSVLLGLNGKFVIRNNASTSTSTTATSSNALNSVISFDALGNAFFAGEVRADKITANSILGLDVISNRFSEISGNVSSLVASSSADILESLNENLTTSDINVLNGAHFGGNASFASSTSFASGLYVEGDLIQNGLASTTELRALKIIASEIDSPLFNALVASTTSLESRVAILENELLAVQKEPNQGDTSLIPSIMEGFQSLSGKVSEQSLSLLSYNDIIKVASTTALSNATETLEEAEEIYKTSFLNDFVNKVSLVAGKVVARFAFVEKLFTSTMTIVPNGQITVPAGVNQMAGEGLLPAGQISIFVSNKNVASTSQIIVTPLVVIGGPLAVVEKREGEGFVVSIKTVELADVPFDYLIIQTYGGVPRLVPNTVSNSISGPSEPSQPAPQVVPEQGVPEVISTPEPPEPEITPTPPEPEAPPVLESLPTVNPPVVDEPVGDAPEE